MALSSSVLSVHQHLEWRTMDVKCQGDPVSHTQQRYPVGTGPQSHEEHNNYNNSSMLIHCSCSNSAAVAPNAQPIEERKLDTALDLALSSQLITVLCTKVTAHCTRYTETKKSQNWAINVDC